MRRKFFPCRNNLVILIWAKPPPRIFHCKCHVILRLLLCKGSLQYSAHGLQSELTRWFTVKLPPLMFYESVVLVQDGSVPWPYLSRPASSDSVLALGCGALRSLFSFANSVGFCLAPLGPQLGNVEDTRRKRNPCMLLTNQHCLKGARGTPASSPRFSECPHSETLFPCFTGPLSKLLHCCSTV